MTPISLATIALALFACSAPPGRNATPLESTIVVMGQRLADDNVTLEQFPECLGVAVGAELILTSDHCPIALEDAYVVVTAAMWEQTASANVLADAIRVRGEVRELKPRHPLDAWIGTAAAANGEATRVVLRGTDLVELKTTLSGDMLTGGVSKGDSGGPIFQTVAVGLTQACNSTDTVACDLPGGRFSGP